jgi:membrane protease subunit HflK
VLPRSNCMVPGKSLSENSKKSKPMKSANTSYASPGGNKRLLNLILRLTALGAVLLLLLIVAFTSVYTVPADSSAAVQHFGRYVRSEDPGLHFKMPFGIDTITIIPVRRQLKLEFGFGTQGASNSHQRSTDEEGEKDMVTGDLNSVQVEWVVEYQISDVHQYLFEVQDPEDTLRAATEAVMREVIGDRTIDEVITFGREAIETECTTRLIPVADEYKLGIKVGRVQLKNINPPGPVQAAFDAVNNAQQQKQQAINKALGDYNSVVPKAKGEAERVIDEAKGTAQKRINEAKGNAAYFTDLLAQYSKAPEITRQRIYLETMAEVIPKSGAKIIVDDELSHALPLFGFPEIQKR